MENIHYPFLIPFLKKCSIEEEYLVDTPLKPGDRYYEVIKERVLVKGPKRGDLGNIPELIMKQFMYTVEDDKRFLITKYRTQAGFIQFKTETRTYSLRVIPYPLIVENELKTLIASRIEVPTNSFLMELSEVPN